MPVTLCDWLPVMPLPKLYQLEQTYGSFILGGIAKHFHIEVNATGWLHEKFSLLMGDLVT